MWDMCLAFMADNSAASVASDHLSMRSGCMNEPFNRPWPAGSSFTTGGATGGGLHAVAQAPLICTQNWSTLYRMRSEKYYQLSDPPADRFTLEVTARTE